MFWALLCGLAGCQCAACCEARGDRSVGHKTCYWANLYRHAQQQPACSLSVLVANTYISFVVMPHQVCSKCNETKAPSEFYVSKYLSTGLHSQCKKCVRAGQERRVRCPPEKAAPEKVCRCGVVAWLQTLQLQPCSTAQTTPQMKTLLVPVSQPAPRPASAESGTRCEFGHLTRRPDSVANSTGCGARCCDGLCV